MQNLRVIGLRKVAFAIAVTTISFVFSVDLAIHFVCIGIFVWLVSEVLATCRKSKASYREYEERLFTTPRDDSDCSQELIRTRTLCPKRDVYETTPMPDHYGGKGCTDSEGKCPCLYSTSLEHDSLPLEGALHFSTKDFYGFSRCCTGVETLKSTVKEFGIGTCGPRAFYGTMEPHIGLEKEFSSWMGTEAAISYPSYSSVPLSLVMAFMSNKGESKSRIDFNQQHLNFLLIDEGCNPIIKIAARSLCGKSYREFVHNDHRSLGNILNDLSDEWTRGKDPRKYSCFVILEGIYERTGLVCNLDKILEVCKRPRKTLPNVHVILDDTLAVGVLGNTLRGSWEHYGLSTDDFYLLYCGLDCAIGSNGAICYGNQNLIEFQRTGGSGYTFSASLPTMFSSVALNSIKTLRDPDTIISKRNQLLECIQTLRYAFDQHKKLNTLFRVLYDLNNEACPLIVLVPIRKRENLAQLTRVLRQHYGISIFLAQRDSSKLMEFSELRMFVNALSYDREWLRKVPETIYICFETIPDGSSSSSKHVRVYPNRVTNCTVKTYAHGLCNGTDSDILFPHTGGRVQISKPKNDWNHKVYPSEGCTYAIRGHHTFVSQ